MTRAEAVRRIDRALWRDGCSAVDFVAILSEFDAGQLSDADRARVMKCATDAIEGSGWLFDHATFEIALAAAGFAIVRVTT